MSLQSHSNGFSPDNKTDDSDRTVPYEKYRRHVTRARSVHDHFTFHRSFVTVLKLSKTLALFLQDLINHASMKGTIHNDSGWFLCTVGYLKNSLDWSKATQSRLLADLKKLGYIEIAWNEHNSQRWINIDTEKIEDLIDEKINAGWKQKEGGSQNESTPGLKTDRGLKMSPPPDSKRVLNKERNVIKDGIHCRHDATASGDDAKPIKSNGKPTKVKARGDSQTRGQARSSSGSTKDGERSRVVGDVNPESKVEENGKRHARGQARSHSNRINGFPVENGKPVRASVDVTEFGTRTAILLRDGLMAKNKIMRHPSIEKWSISLREMRTLLMDSRKLTRQEAERSIEELINDHVKHIRDDYQPEAYSADTFCKKYESIERARDRRSRKRKPVKTIKNDNGSVKRIYPDDPEYDQYLPDEDTHSVKIIAIDAATGRVMSRDEFTDDEDY